ncbi:MAG: hypothetical protein ACQESF_02640 [Nanobdellota archaeon]
MITEKLFKIQQEVFKTAQDSGFYRNLQQPEKCISHLHCEINEAHDAYCEWGNSEIFHEEIADIAIRALSYCFHRAFFTIGDKITKHLGIISSDEKSFLEHCYYTCVADYGPEFDWECFMILHKATTKIYSDFCKYGFETVENNFAKLFIVTAAVARKYEINLFKEIGKKNEKNKSRPYRHKLFAA